MDYLPIHYQKNLLENNNDTNYRNIVGKLCINYCPENQGHYSEEDSGELLHKDIKEME